MKIFKIFSLLLAAGLMATSCENDIDPKIPGNAVSPEFTAPATGKTEVLLKANEEEVFTTFEWTPADLKLNAVVTYNLEVDDQDGNFSNRRIIASKVTSPLAINVADFNKGLLAAGYVVGVAHNIQVRIVASNALASESINFTVTPYFDVEPWYIIGSAVGGWDLVNDKFMNYDSETATYYLTLDMKPGEFKFRASKKDDDPWKFNLGMEAGALIDNGNDIALKSNGSNVTVGGGNYTVTLDVVHNQFSIKQNSAGEFTVWTNVVLDAVGEGISVDNSTAKDDESGWNWGNVILPDNDGKPTASAAVYSWKWTGVTLEADKGFKIRTQNGVASPVNGMSFDVGFGVLNGAESSVKVVDLSGNFSVNAKGRYNIEINIDATNGDAKEVIIIEYLEYPANLYAVGDGVTTGWDWANDALEMVPVHSHPELFWKILWIDANEGFKFNSAKAWDGNQFGEPADAANVINSIVDFGTENITVAASGYYMVVVDMKNHKIELAEPKVYGMGDAFGGWDAAQAANLFAVDNVAQTISYASVPNNGTLRMHATASTLICDWWQAEFNIVGGAIEYRGTGGDQTGIPSVVTGNKITLNFKEMTGTVE